MVSIRSTDGVEFGTVCLSACRGVDEMNQLQGLIDPGVAPLDWKGGAKGGALHAPSPSSSPFVFSYSLASSLSLSLRSDSLSPTP